MNADETLGKLPIAAQEIMTAIIAYLPQLGGALLLLLVGWLIAAVLRAVTRRLQAAANRLLPPTLRRRAVPSGVGARVLPGAVYWLVLLAFVATAAQLLGLNLFSEWLGALLRYLPLLLAGVLVVFVGFLLSQLSRDLITSTTASAGLQYPVLLGYSGQAVVLLLATVIGLDLIGLDTRVLTMLAGIAAAAIAGGIALSFGLGAQREVSNRLAARTLRQRYQIGDIIRIAEYEGAIMDITVQGCSLDTTAGRVDLPAHLFSEQPCTVVMSEPADD